MLFRSKSSIAVPVYLGSQFLTISIFVFILTSYLCYFSGVFIMALVSSIGVNGGSGTINYVLDPSVPLN